MRLKFLGTGSADVGGAVAVGWTPDTTFELGERDFTNVNVVLALERSAVVRLDGRDGFNIPVDPQYRWYSTTGGKEVSAHGKFYIVVVTPPVLAKGVFSMLVELEWSVHFEGRRIADLTSGPHSIVPASGYDNLFTTSDGSFDATVLTFKSTAGGSMVPFVGLHPNVIYRQMQGSGEKVQYYATKADGTEVLADAYYFTKVQDYAIHGLVLHASEAYAKAYIKTGKKDYCIKYVKAGPYTSPGRPIFVADPGTISGDWIQDFSLLSLQPEVGAPGGSR